MYPMPYMDKGAAGPYAVPGMMGYARQPAAFSRLQQALGRLGYPGGAGFGYPMAAAGPTAGMGPGFPPSMFPGMMPGFQLSLGGTPVITATLGGQN